MVISARGALTVALLAASGCLSTAANDYLFSCANGQSCPSRTSCAGDNLCHPVFTPGAGPADAGSYACASTSPQCPDGEACESNGLCTAADGGASDAGPDAGPDAGSSDAGPDAGPPDAGSPDAGDAGSPDAGPDAGPPCDLRIAFASPVRVSCGTDCAGLAVGDFNHDGFNDVVVGVDLDSNNAGGVGLFINRQDGTFGFPLASRTVMTCGPPEDDNGWTTIDALASADFNGDGWPDLGFSNSSGGQIGIALNGQDGGFVFTGFQPSPSQTCNSDSYPYSNVAAFQEQAGQDWFVGAVGFGLYDTDENPLFVASRVQSNAQGLDPWVAVSPAEDFTPYGFTVGQFSDGSLATVALAEDDGNGHGQIELFPGDQSGSTDGIGTTASGTLSCRPGTTTASTADLDGDGIPDLVCVNTSDDSISVFYGNAAGEFANGAVFSTDLMDAGVGPIQAAIGDFDGDGRPDIATINVGHSQDGTPAGNVTILKGLTDGGFLAVAAISSTIDIPYWISAVDLETKNVADGGIPDLVVASLVNSSESAIEVFKNNCR